MHVYIYVYIYICGYNVHIYIYIYIHIMKNHKRDVIEQTLLGNGSPRPISSNLTWVGIGTSIESPILNHHSQTFWLHDESMILYLSHGLEIAQ